MRSPRRQNLIEKKEKQKQNQNPDDAETREFVTNFFHPSSSITIYMFLFIENFVK